MWGPGHCHAVKTVFLHRYSLIVHDINTAVNYCQFCIIANACSLQLFKFCSTSMYFAQNFVVPFIRKPPCFAFPDINLGSDCKKNATTDIAMHNISAT